MDDHQQRDFVMVVQAVRFNPKVTPALNNLSRFGQSAKVPPLRDRGLDLFYGFRVAQC